MSFSFVLLEERRFEDWIVDAAWENDLSHVVLATAHNSLLRCEFPNLTERCREKFESADELREFKRSTENTASTNIHKDSESDAKEDYKHTLSLDKPHGSEQQKQYGCHRLDSSIVAKVECTEKCVLFCGRVVMMSGSWMSAVLLAGMVSQQVVIWGPWGEKDDCNRIIPFHCISGHEVSVLM